MDRKRRGPGSFRGRSQTVGLLAGLLDGLANRRLGVRDRLLSGDELAGDGGAGDRDPLHFFFVLRLETEERARRSDKYITLRYAPILMYNEDAALACGILVASAIGLRSRIPAVRLHRDLPHFFTVRPTVLHPAYSLRRGRGRKSSLVGSLEEVRDAAPPFVFGSLRTRL